MAQEIDLVFDALQNTEQGKRIDNHKVVIRCPICGEGTKKHSHGHCYIGMINDGPPLVYHCFISECSGVVTPQFLADVGIEDDSLNNILNIFNKSYSKMSREARKIVYVNKKIENTIVPDILDSPINQAKRYYLSKRIGINFSYNDMKSLRVICSLKDFLSVNNLKPNEKNRFYINTIDRDYIGFLANGNDFIIFRDVTNKNKLRYVKYDIYNSFKSSNIVYTIPGTKCDMFAPSVELNVAEGTFDVLGIFCNVKNFERNNAIYAACCGSGYLNTIRYFIRMGFIGNLVVNIFSDRDKDLSYYSRKLDLFNKIKPWVKQINIFYNESSKDFGVPKSEISISKVPQYY